MFKFVVIDGLLAGVKSVFSTPKCEQCILLKELWEHERDKRDYYEQLLLSKTGLITPTAENVMDLSSFPSIRRGMSLSQVRTALESESRQKARVAASSEKSKAETLFEESLNKTNENSNQTN